MKKLMTMLAAVGLAFGLFADEPEPIEPINSTSFEAAGDFNGDNNLVFGSSWSCADTDAKLTKGLYDEDDYEYDSNNKRYWKFGDTQANFLDIKTSFTNPLERAENVTISEGEEVYFDQLVKFTAFEEPAEITGDAKIALYVQEVMDENDEPTATNLCVVAGKYVADALIQVTNEFPFADVDAWHRVTIKTLKGYDNANLAFQIFVDSVALEMATPAFDPASAAALSKDARVINSAKKLFAALNTKDPVEVKSIAFAGTGAIDDVIATTQEPGEWAQNKVVTINWDPEVTGFTYTFGGDSTTVTTEGADSVQIPFSGEFKVKLTNMNFSNNWIYAGYDLVNKDEEEPIHYDGDEITFSGEGQTATIKAKDNTPRMVVLDDQGEETEKTYPNFAVALADPTLATGTLKLKMGVNVDMNGVITAGTIGIGKDITIDLAGQTITGIADFADGYIFNVLGGKLTIKDSSGDNSGKIVVGQDADYAGIISVGSIDDQNIGTLNISGGTFDGAIIVDPGQAGEEGWPAADAAIFGGKFDEDTNSTKNDKFTLEAFVDESCDLTNAEGYWVVTPATIWTVTFYNGEDVFTTQKVRDNELATKPETDPTKPYYTFDKWVDADGQEFTFAAQITKDTSLYATWTANEFTVKYFDSNDEGGEALKTNTFTAVNYESLELWDGEREGYEFDGTWYDADWTTFTTTQNLLDAIDNKIKSKVDNLSIELNGSWTEAPTDVTVTLPELPITGVESLVVSQKVEDVWEDVTETKKVGVGNEYVVVAIPAAGYKAENPIVSGTAAAGTPIAVTKEQVEANVAEIVYVAQIGDDPEKKFETLAEAIAALDGGETINLLKAYQMPDAGVNFNKNCTFDLGGNTLTVDGDEANSNFWVTAAVTFKNGTITETNTGNRPLYVQDGAELSLTNVSITAEGTAGPAIDVIAATINVYADTTITSQGDVFRIKEAGAYETTINVYGGELKTTGNKGIFYHYKLDGRKLFVNIYDGEFTASESCGVFEIKDNADTTCTLGADCKAKFSTDKGLAAYCAEGYKAKKSEGSEWYTIQAIQYATLAVDADAGITYVLTNKTTEAVVAAGYKADIDNAEVIEAIELGFAKGYELDAAASTTSVTLDAAETKTIVLKKQATEYTITYTTGNGTEVTNGVFKYTIATETFNLPGAADIDMKSVEGVTFAGWTNATSEAEVVTQVTKGTTGNLEFFAKWAAVVPEQKVEPGEEKEYDTEDKAKDAAKNINDHKDTMINVPTQASGDKAAYLARVEAKVNGTKVVVDIAADAEATFKGELDTEIKKADVAAALTDATATKATITTKAGFYYWIEGGVEVGTIDTNGGAVIGDGKAVTLEKPTLETTDKAFYKLAVGVKAPAAE